MISELYKRSLYLNKNIDYLFNASIIEYDLKYAGFNLIKYFNLLPKSTIAILEKMPKDKGHVEIGMLQRRNKKLVKELGEAFEEARKMFFIANNLTDSDILAIKKDAIFVINKECPNNIFGNLEFRKKNVYIGYLYLNRVEFYYKAPNQPLDVKNISDDALEYHKEYMLDFIKDLFTYAIYSPREELVNFLTNFIKYYSNKELDYGYYRNLDQESYFIIFNDSGEKIAIRDINDDNVIIDRTYNYFKYIVPIINIFI